MLKEIKTKEGCISMENVRLYLSAVTNKTESYAFFFPSPFVFLSFLFFFPFLFSLSRFLFFLFPFRLFSLSLLSLARAFVCLPLFFGPLPLRLPLSTSKQHRQRQSRRVSRVQRRNKREWGLRRTADGTREPYTADVTKPGRQKKTLKKKVKPKMKKNGRKALAVLG